MSRVGTKWAWKTSVSPPSRKLLLLCLCEMANDSGELTASQARLSKATGITRSVLILHLNALIDDGLVMRQAHYRQNGRRAVNTYYVGFSKMFRFIKAKQQEEKALEGLEVEHAIY